MAISPFSSHTIGIYLAAVVKVINTVLFRDEDEKPMYFISKKLAGGKPNYSKLEKVILAIIYVSWRLKPYLQGRLVKVYIKYPLRKIFHDAQELSRLAEWMSYLSA